MWIQEKNPSAHGPAAAVVVVVTQVTFTSHHQNDVLQINTLRKSHPYHDAVVKIVRLDHGLCPLARKNVHVKSGVLRVRNQVLGVNVNPLNANVHLEDKEAVTVVEVEVVDLHYLIKRRDVIAQVVRVLLAVPQAVITPAVLVLVHLAVLCLAVVQSLDLHLFLGGGGRLAF